MPWWNPLRKGQRDVTTPGLTRPAPVDSGEQDIAPVDWEQWWRDKVSQGSIEHWRRGSVQAPIVNYRDGGYCPATNDLLLEEIMPECGLRTVLCAGNGVSDKAGLLAAAGFDVTALDISPTATRLAESFEQNRDRLAGRLEFVAGDLLDKAICPGPVDVVIERRTVQTFPARERPAALRALTARLGPVGIFVTHCNDGSYGVGRKWFHASEAWLREQNWQVWERVPELPLAGQAAWLVRSAD